ncbi:MAG: aminoacyl-tRNA hydrolase [Candidatus Omnitrophota bacterium]
MKLIFGLGNPGRSYAKNRHNIGYRVLDKLSERLGFRFKRNLLCRARMARVKIADQDVLFVKPATYMNKSGICARRVIKSFSVPLKDSLFVYDDIDLPKGALRFRESGSSAGHRGIASVINAFQTEQLNRLRLGIGRNGSQDAADYVLSDFIKEEEENISEVIDKALAACLDWIKFGNVYVIKNCNKR